MKRLILAGIVLFLWGWFAAYIQYYHSRYDAGVHDGVAALRQTESIIPDWQFAAPADSRVFTSLNSYSFDGSLAMISMTWRCACASEAPGDSLGIELGEINPQRQVRCKIYGDFSDIAERYGVNPLSADWKGERNLLAVDNQTHKEYDGDELIRAALARYKEGQ